MKKLMKIMSLVIFTVYLTSCASGGGGSSNASSGGDECNAVTAGAMGAVVGGLLGAAIDGNNGATKGAAAGALVGSIGCIAYNYQTEQTKTAQQVNQEYQTSHGNLPATPKVVDHKIAFSKSTAARGKDNIKISSNSIIVDGASQPVTKVEEKLVIVDQQGNKKPISTKSPTNKSGGEYVNTFEITPPEKMAEGKYKIESDIYVNGKLASQTGGSINVVYRDNEIMLAGN